MASLRFVIVEDEEAHFTLMERALLRRFPGALVHYFREAEACLDVLDEIDPDVIITDYLLPGLTGIGFLEALSRRPKDIPVIMITGQGDEKIAVQAMKLGAWDYLVKTSHFSALIPGVVEKVIREQSLKESLERSERRFQDLAERTCDWIWEIDPQGKYTYSNPMVEGILGYCPDEVMGRHYHDFFSDQDAKGGRALEFMVEGRPVQGLEGRLLHKDGHETVVETNAVPFFDKRGRLAGYRGIHRDISERKRAEEALRWSEEKFRRIFEESPIGIALFGPEGRLIDANHSCKETFGIRNVQGVEASAFLENSHLTAVDRERLSKGERVRYETTYDSEKRVLTSSSEDTGSDSLLVDVLITPLAREPGGGLSGYLVQVQDITKRKHAEAHIRSLSQQLLRIQERERLNISRDLHDHLAQDLSTLKISLDTLYSDEPDVSEDRKRRVRELSKTVQRSISGVRDLVYGLRPPSLDQLGLVQTILQHCEETSQKSGLKIDFFSAGMDGIELDPDMEIALYRLIQEGLNNIINHAQADCATVRLVESFPHIILRIEDNGKGFDVADRLEQATKERRLGIRSMQERVALLRGKMQIGSRPLRGTSIVVEIPYQEEDLG